MAVYRSSSRGNTTGVSVVDDGTNYEFSVGSTKLFQVNKTSGQFQIKGGFDSDITL